MHVRVHQLYSVKTSARAGQLAANFNALPPGGRQDIGDAFFRKSSFLQDRWKPLASDYPEARGWPQRSLLCCPPSQLDLALEAVNANPSSQASALCTFYSQNRGRRTPPVHDACSKGVGN